VHRSNFLGSRSLRDFQRRSPDWRTGVNRNPKGRLQMAILVAVCLLAVFRKIQTGCFYL